MAVDQNINDLFDLESIDAQYDHVMRRVDEYVNIIDKVNKTSQISFKEFKGAKSLNDFNKSAVDAANATSRMAVGLDGLKSMSEKTATIMAVMNGHSKEFIGNLKSMEQAEKAAAQAASMRAKAATETAKQSEIASKASLNEAKAATEAARAREIEARYVALLTKEKERLEKQAEKERLAAAKLENAYEQLKREYNETSKEAMRLGAAYGVNSTQAREFSARAMEMNKRLIEIEESVGRHQRKVGDYGRATFALSQLIREAPAFANSISTGLSALSNNFPMLFDEFKKLREVTGSTAQSMKILFGSIFSFTNLFMLGYAAFEIFGKQLFQAKKEADELNKSLLQLKDTIQETYEAEVKSAGDLMRIAASVEMPHAARVKAMEDLIKMYPELLGYIDQEAFLSGKLGNTLDALSTVISQQTKIQEIEETIKLLIKQRQELTEKEKEGEGFFEGIFGFKGQHGDVVEKLASVNKRIFDLKDTLRILKTELSFMLNPKRTDNSRLLGDIDADIKKYELIRDLNAANTKAHKDALKEIEKLEKERAAFLGKEDKSAVSGVNELLEARKRNAKVTADLEKQRYLQQENTSREIFESENRSLAERLEAHQKFMQAEIMVANIESASEIAIVEDKLKNIQEKERLYTAGRLKLNKQQLQALKLDEDTFNKELTAKREMLETALTGITARGIVTENAIRKSSREKELRELRTFLAGEQTELQERIADWEDMYNQEANAAAESYLKHEIGEKAFHERLRRLRLQYTAVELEAQMKEDEFLLTQDKLTAEMRLQIQRDLNSARRKLSETQIEQANGKGKYSLGLTDADFERMNNYLQVGAQAVEMERALDELISQRYQKEIDAIEKKKKALQENADTEIDAINKSSLSEESKAEKIAQIKAASDAQEREYITRQNELKRRQAILDKGAAAAAVVQQTSVAVMSALKIPPPFGQILAAGIGVTGGLQLAKVLGTEIPAYAEGVDDKPESGLALVGEEHKPELVLQPGQAPQVVDTPTLMFLEKHSQVIPQKKIVSRLAGMTGMLSPDILMAMQPGMSTTALEDVTRQGFADLKRTIQDKQETHFHWDDGQLVKSVKRGHSWQHYLSLKLGK